MIKNPKYLFIVGGVISGVGKGVAASSIARIIKNRGFSVTAIKIDPYINIDAGTMNPTEHGEVFVLSDGDETDQDMGNYERFLNTDLTRINYMTTGRVYQSVIEKERSLHYKGKCVEVVPHIPLEVIERIEKAQIKAKADVTIIEIGGTVGEYQNMLFLEAARMLKIKYPHDVFFGMVSYLPIPSKVGEMKTKPTQTAVRTLNASGILPDLIIARSAEPLDQKRKEKISIFCNVAPDRIISAPDVSSIYDVPENFEKEGLGDMLTTIMHLPKKHLAYSEATDWNNFVKNVHGKQKVIKIAVIGKYFETGEYVLSDAYMSVIEAIKYSSYSQNIRPELHWINVVDFENGKIKLNSLKKFDGVLAPGGFGARGVEGIISVIEFVRKNKIPYFGICYGMQLAIIEYARHVLGMKDAHTTEVNVKTKNPVIHIMKSQKAHLDREHYGGNMRLGSYEAHISKQSHAYKAYGKESVVERHRHRYEFNNEYRTEFEKNGVVFSGVSPDQSLVEIMELPVSKHPFFVGVQFHPEFRARPLDPHQLFTAFIKASIVHHKKNTKS
jgi:CTP synthase